VDKNFIYLYYVLIIEDFAMSYITITLYDGSQKEVSDISQVSQDEARLFNVELNRRIRENYQTGKSVFDGIDWPKGEARWKNYGDHASSFARETENNTLLKEALYIQLSREYSQKSQGMQPDGMLKTALNFTNRLIVDDKNVVKKWMEPLYQELKGANVLNNSEVWNLMPLTTAVWMQDYARSENKAEPYFRYVCGAENGKMSQGEVIEPKVTKVLVRNLDKMEERDVEALYPVLLKSDFSQLSDEDKDKILAAVQRIPEKGKEQEFINQTAIENLSYKSFLRKTNMTFDDAKSFLGRGGSFEESDKYYAQRLSDLYQELHKAPKENDAVAAIRGQIAANVECRHIPGVHVTEEDFLRGVRDNPDALKAQRPNLSTRVLYMLSRDENLSKDPNFKFLVDRREELKPYVAHRSLEHVDALPVIEQNLASVAREGFSAGYGAELVIQDADRYLAENRSNIEKDYQVVMANAKIEQEYSQIKEETTPLVELNAAAWRAPYNRHSEKWGYSKEVLFEMAKAKALETKEVAPLKYEAKKMLGIPLPGEKEKEEFFREANKYIDGFAKAYSKNKLLEKYQDLSLQKLDQQRWHHVEVVQNGLSGMEGYNYSASLRAEDIVGLKEQCDRIGALKDQAQRKLEMQMEASKVSHREGTSGRKDTQENTGFDLLAEKGKIREQNPELSVRDLYAATIDKRRENEYLKMNEAKAQDVPEIVNVENKSNAQEINASVAISNVQVAETITKADIVEPVLKKAEQVKESIPLETLVAEKGMPKDFATKQALINAVKDGSYKGPALVRIDEELKSKNPDIQKAIDLVRGGSFKNIEELKALDEYKLLPKYAKRCAEKLCGTVATDSLNLMTTQKKADALARVAVKQAEKTAKEQINKLRAPKRTPSKVKSIDAKSIDIIHKMATKRERI